MINKYSILVVFIFSVLVRFYYLQNSSVFFYFDQARDAVASRSIFEKNDIKIQGPSVSGTEDSVYHGVFYYYLIAPIYTISGGNPLAVAYFLAVIVSLSVFIIYQIGIDIFKSKLIGILGAFFTSLSSVVVHRDIWLSNPQLTGVLLPLAYLYLWRIFFLGKKEIKNRDYFLFGLIIALVLQSALQSIVFLGSILLATIYYIYKNKTFKIFSYSNIFFMASSFLVGVSTMILTEVLMWRRGILSFESLNLGQHSSSLSLDLITKISEKYLSLLKIFLAPSASILIFLLLLVPVFLYIFKAKKQQLLWLSLLFFSPLWLLLWHYRDPNHTFIGLEVAIYLSFSAGLVYLLRFSLFGKYLSLVLGITFIILQVNNLQQWNYNREQYFGIQKGALLSEQLGLIHKTYEEANGSTFTFSTLASPYAINTTWSYLYSWYGDLKFGVKPVFVGMPQAGYPGDFLLEEMTSPNKIHFTIIEPDTTLSEELIRDFLMKQELLAGEVSKEWDFGSLKLQLR